MAIVTSEYKSWRLLPPGVLSVSTSPIRVAPRRRGRSTGGATRAVELTELVTTQAGELASTHALRGADAVHVASLLAVGADDTLFAVWDQRLRAEAQSAGVQLAPLE